MPDRQLISIVDDDQSVCLGMMNLIEAMGFAAEAFRSAEAFWNSNSLRRTSCLIADVQMPGMTELELYGRLVGSGGFIPTILITAFPNEEERARALRAGAVGYLIKPFGDSELLACIGSALECGPGYRRMKLVVLSGSGERGNARCAARFTPICRRGVLAHSRKCMGPAAWDRALTEGYPVIVPCGVAGCAAIDKIIHEHFDTGATLTIDADSCRHLACIVARLHCTKAERSMLVRLIDRLGLEPSIRSVRWERLQPS